MDSKEKTTPQKRQNILYEHVQGKLGLNSDSPFRVMPNFSTPPTRFTKIFNPFEAHLSERLHLPVFSPSVFTSTSSPKTEDKFRWTIDDISMLKPADIEPSSWEQYESTEHDSALESKMQEKINVFFSEKVIVPSPLCQPVETQPLISGASSPADSDRQTCDVATQTTLSLPLTLPKHVEDVLKPYFRTDCDQDSRIQELYRQLFESEEQAAPNSAQSSPALSFGLLSPIEMSPVHEIRNSGVFCNTPPDLSPIAGTSAMRADVPRERRSAARLDFSGNMSTDSAGLVPDRSAPLASNSTLEFASVASPPRRQDLSDASNNWDLEYKHVSLANEDSVTEMDVSNSNTPRSRIFFSQRKKLSESFMREDFEREDLCVVQGVVPCKKALVGDDTDVGYQTGSIVLSEDSAWGARVHLFASTPTKNMKQSV